MEKPEITRNDVKPLFESRFIKVFDLQYAPGKHYYDATRRSAEQLAAVKNDADFRKMLPDAVSCFVILDRENEEPRLLLTKEFRYPTGRFLLSVPAGLIDPEDCAGEAPALTAAAREIEEETGIRLTPEDRLMLVNPLVFSTPGMTDESNALACAVIHSAAAAHLTQEGAIGSECFNGFQPMTKAQALAVLKAGRDDEEIFYSVYTWMAMMFFVSELWKVW